MLSRFSLGQEAEDKASGYLRSLGWKILSRSRRINQVEVDILASHEEQEIPMTALVEVKMVKKSHYKQGFPVFSWRQFRRYKNAMNSLQEQAGYLFDAHISLIVFDERVDIIDFFPFFDA